MQYNKLKERILLIVSMSSFDLNCIYNVEFCDHGFFENTVIIQYFGFSTMKKASIVH